MPTSPSDPEWLKACRRKGLVTNVVTVNTQAINALTGPNPVTLAQLGQVETEADFQQRVIDLAHALGWVVASFRRVRVQRADGRVYWETPVGADAKGFPDLELVRDRIVKAELKVGRNVPTPEQNAWLEAYRKAGVECYVWRPENWSDIVSTLTRSGGSDAKAVHDCEGRDAVDGGPGRGARPAHSG